MLYLQFLKSVVVIVRIRLNLTLNNVESIESVSVDIEKKSVEVISFSDLDMMNVSQLLDEQGYTVVQSE